MHHSLFGSYRGNPDTWLWYSISCVKHDNINIYLSLSFALLCWVVYNRYHSVTFLVCMKAMESSSLSIYVLLSYDWSCKNVKSLLNKQPMDPFFVIFIDTALWYIDITHSVWQYLGLTFCLDACSVTFGLIKSLSNGSVFKP